jgi:hypothetical protein
MSSEENSLQGEMHWRIGMEKAAGGTEENG